jgi:hypothetical protein
MLKLKVPKKQSATASNCWNGAITITGVAKGQQLLQFQLMVLNHVTYCYCKSSWCKNNYVTLDKDSVEIEAEATDTVNNY